MSVNVSDLSAGWFTDDAASAMQQQAANFPGIVPPKGVDQGSNAPATVVVTPGGAVTVPTVPGGNLPAEVKEVVFAPGWFTNAAEMIKPRPERCGFFCRNKTPLLIGAGVLVLGGAVVWMMAKTASGFKRPAPAMAGIGRRRSRRRHRR